MLPKLALLKGFVTATEKQIRQKKKARELRIDNNVCSIWLIKEKNNIGERMLAYWGVLKD